MNRRQFLLLPCLVAAAISNPQQSARSQPPSPAPAAPQAETPSDLTFDKIIAALQQGGFNAQRALPPYEALGDIHTNLRWLTQMDAVIKIIPCGLYSPNKNSSHASICALIFKAAYKGFPGASPERIAVLNANSFAHVVSDGEHGLRAEYAYPCEGFPDAKFVPMVLEEFSRMVIRLFPRPPEKSGLLDEPEKSDAQPKPK